MISPNHGYGSKDAERLQKHVAFLDNRLEKLHKEHAQLDEVLKAGKQTIEQLKDEVADKDRVIANLNYQVSQE